MEGKDPGLLNEFFRYQQIRMGADKNILVRR